MPHIRRVPGLTFLLRTGHPEKSTRSRKVALTSSMTVTVEITYDHRSDHMFGGSLGAYGKRRRRLLAMPSLRCFFLPNGRLFACWAGELRPSLLRLNVRTTDNSAVTVTTLE